MPEAASKFKKHLVPDALAKCGKARPLMRLGLLRLPRGRIKLVVVVSCTRKMCRGLMEDTTPARQEVHASRQCSSFCWQVLKRAPEKLGESKRLQLSS